MRCTIRSLVWVGIVTILVASPVAAQEEMPPMTAAEEVPPPPPPDEITLKDGSKIVGTIKTLGKGVLTIETASSSSGAIEIKFSEIATLKSETIHTLLLEDGSSVKGKPRLDAGGLVVDTDASGTIPVDVAKVRAINPPTPKAVTHRGEISANARVTDGNSRTKAAGATAFYEMRTKSTRLFMQGAWNYAEDNGVRSARNTTGRLKYDYFVSKRLFTYAQALFQGDEFADLDLRTTVGAGAGYQFKDKALDDSSWSYFEEVGVSYFNENFDSAPDDDYAAGRLSGFLEWDIREGVSFFHFHEAYQGFEDQDDTFVDTRTGFRFAILGNLFANAQVNWRWDNTPAPGNRRADTEYLFGLGYKFEF